MVDLWRINGGLMEDLWRIYGGFMMDLWRIYWCCLLRIVYCRGGSSTLLFVWTYTNELDFLRVFRFSAFFQVSSFAIHSRAWATDMSFMSQSAFLCISCQFLRRMEDLWRIYGGFMEDLWWIYGGFMEDLWRMYGGFMEDLWRIYGWFMDDLWTSFPNFDVWI